MATTEFTIIKGKALSFIIKVKQNGTLLPLMLDAGDTFTFSLVDKKLGTKYLASKTMTITSTVLGEVTGIITALESGTLPIKVGEAEDGYIMRPNLRIVIHGTTVAQGNMTAAIEDVYVVNG